MSLRSKKVTRKVVLPVVLLALGCGKSPEEASRDLLAAVEKRDLKGLRESVQAGADVNARDAQGESALRKAVVKGHVETVSALLEAGSDANITYGYGKSARATAFSRGTMETILLFVRAGGDVTGPGGTVAAGRAAGQGSAETVRALLEAGLDVNAEIGDGKTALWQATYEGHDEVIQLLLAASADPSCVPGVLYNPGAEENNHAAPESFRARFETSAGDFVVQVEREWAPLGTDRFYNLVRNGFYDEQRFFRVVFGSLVQFGIHGNPEISARWRDAVMRMILLRRAT